MTIHNENSGGELIDINAATQKNEAAIESAMKENPSMSSFFGGSSGAATEYGGIAGPSRQTSEAEHFMTAGVSFGGGKKVEVVKQGAEVLFDNGSKNPSMFGNGKKGEGSFNISYAGERGAPTGSTVKRQPTPIVDPGYFTKFAMARKGGSPGASVDKNHTIFMNVTAAGNAVSGASYSHRGQTFTPAIAPPTSDMMHQLSGICAMLLQDRMTLERMRNGPISFNRMFESLGDGGDGAEHQLKTMNPGKREELFRSVSPTAKKGMV